MIMVKSSGNTRAAAPTKSIQACMGVQPTCDNPIFIIGSPRSGTSILAWSLAQHSRLWTSDESDILYHLFGDDSVDIAFRTSIERSDGNWLKKQAVEPAEFTSYLGLGLNALFTSRSKGRRWIDQAPTYTYMIDGLARMFPGAFFIHLVRDGRRVVNSMIKSGFEVPWARDFRLACQTCRQSVELSLAFSEKAAARCLTVCNEDLLQQPARSFRKILRFIRADYESAPARYFKNNRINSRYQKDGG